MEFKIDINDNTTIQQYDKLLSSFDNWAAHKREINLNTLLEENKKMEFSVELENSSIFVSATFDGDVEVIGKLNNACLLIKGMKFIINKNKVESLTIKVSSLSTYYGKITKDLITSNIPIKINQYLLDGSVFGFYINDRTIRIA
jgi:hypothetical protein